MTLTGEPVANTGFVGKIKLKKHLKAYFDKCMLVSKIAYNWARSQNLAKYPAYLEAKETYLNSIKELSDEAFLRELRVWKEVKEDLSTLEIMGFHNGRKKVLLFT